MVSIDIINKYAIFSCKACGAIVMVPEGLTFDQIISDHEQFLKEHNHGR